MSIPHLLSFIFSNALVLTLGVSLLPSGIIKSISIRLSVRLFMVIVVASFTVWVCGILGILNPLGLNGVLFCALLLVLVIRWQDIWDSIQETIKDLFQFRNALNGRWLFVGLTCIGFGILFIRSWIHIQVLPPYIWDVLTYHLPKVGDWVQHESLVFLPTPITRSFWPASFELLQAWCVVFFHHDWMVEAAGLPYFIISILAVYGIVRRLGLGGPKSMLAAWVWATTPAALMNAVSGKNDIAVAALFLLAILLILAWKDCLVGSVAFWSIFLAIFCWAVGIKATMVFMAPGLLVALFVSGDLSSIQTIVIDKSAMNRLVVFLIMVLLPAIYWYLRNYIAFDNPFYPVDFHLFGRIIFGDGIGGGQQGTFKASSLFTTLHTLFSTKIWDMGTPMLTADLGEPSRLGLVCCLTRSPQPCYGQFFQQTFGLALLCFFGLVHWTLLRG